MDPTPFVKWAGGKRQLLDQIRPLLPKRCRVYFEPFLGGGAMFFRLAAEEMFRVAFLGDVNMELANAYAVVKTSPFLLMSALNRLSHEYEKRPSEFYYELRAQDPATLPAIEAAARFVFLNKSGFNGLYRVNARGKFNVPWGRKGAVTAYETENLRACSSALQAVTVTPIDFADLVEYAQEGDLVYFDPPYVPLTKTSSFTAYSADGFGPEQQKRLAQLFGALTKKGVFCALSNADTNMVRELYREHEIVSVQARRNINCKGGKRGEIGEVVVLGKPS